MSTIITIANQKGGTGKTTIAQNLAGYLSRKKNSVYLIDLDTQESAAYWYRTRKRNKNINDPYLNSSGSYFEKIDLKEQIDKLIKETDFIVIDSPPEDSSITRISLSLANYIIIPMKPSPVDVYSTNYFINVIKEGIQQKKINGEARLLINLKIPGTIIGRDIKAEAEKNFDLTAFKTEICQRIATTEAGVNGQTIFEYAPGSKAAAEFSSIGKEILKWVKK